MYEDKLDIQIAVELETPDVVIEIEEETPEIEITVEEGGSVFPSYDGETVITPLAREEQTLETENKIMKSNIVVREIPFSSVSNPWDGRTVYIGQ